jgi:integrase
MPLHRSLNLKKFIDSIPAPLIKEYSKQKIVDGASPSPNTIDYDFVNKFLDTIQDEDPLFPSRKSKKPLAIMSVNALIKKWTRAINIKGNFGAHSLRKTFGYIQRTQHGVGFEVLARRFNHSSPATTMRYLGIADKEVNGILLNEI